MFRREEGEQTALQTYKKGYTYLISAQRAKEKQVKELGRYEGADNPAIISTAFAAKLGLKALMQLEGKTQLGHGLLDLYATLSHHLQSQIECVLPLELYPQFADGTTTFLGALEAVGDAFVKGHYIEKSKSERMADFTFLMDFAQVVLAVGKEVIPVKYDALATASVH
ncbi:hypothetical protein ACUHMQ_20420 [Chitinimonas sp. PSY-7]|uniref:hypothetical protein n=1 Tax=Chitinimonas sp. PSY-7 TaxID=3459088 RepID=UPI0040402514